MRKNSRSLGNIYQQISKILSNIENLNNSSSRQLKEELEKHNSSIENLKTLKEVIESLYYLGLPDDEIQLNPDYYYVYSADLFIYLLLKEMFLKGINYITSYDYDNDEKICRAIKQNRFNIISRTSYDATDFKDFIKTYATKYKLHIIQNLKLTKEKTRAELVSKFHDNNYIVVLYAGIAFDVKNRIFIYSKDLSEYSRSTVELKQLIFLTYTSNDLTNLEKEVINDLRNQTEKLFNPIKKSFNWIDMFIIEESIITNRKNNLRYTISELNNKIENLEQEIKEKINNLNTKNYELFYLENKPMEYKISELINRYKREKLIYNVQITDDKYLIIDWFAIPVTLFDNDNLERALNNLGIDDDRKELLRKVINGEYTMFSAPLQTKLNLTNLEFKTYKVGNYNNISYNGHPLYYENKGCRGTFNVPMYEAKTEGNLYKLLILIKQYYQSITVNDVLGNDFCRYSIIVDENNNIAGTERNIYEYYNVYGELPKEEDSEY